MKEKTVFLFPGQGSQSLGMLSDCMMHDIVQQTFAEAASVLGQDLSLFLQAEAIIELNRTENTQPVLLTVSVALWRLWCELSNNLYPQFMAGHSLGEYSALVCSGALSFSDAIMLVRKRGQYMQNAVSGNEGAMAAIIGLEDDIVIKLCREYDSSVHDHHIVEAVNFNAPGQVVIAGHMHAVQDVMRSVVLAGGRAKQLSVSVPSHCALMKPAAKALEEDIAAVKISMPRIPVIHNVSAQKSKTAAGIKQLLIKQLYSPVQWVQSMRNIQSLGGQQFIECGPGRVLAGLMRRIDRKAPILGLSSLVTLEEVLSII